MFWSVSHCSSFVFFGNLGHTTGIFSLCAFWVAVLVTKPIAFLPVWRRRSCDEFFSRPVFPPFFIEVFVLSLTRWAKSRPTRRLLYVKGCVVIKCWICSFYIFQNKVSATYFLFMDFVRHWKALSVSDSLYFSQGSHYFCYFRGLSWRPTSGVSNSSSTAMDTPSQTFAVTSSVHAADACSTWVPSSFTEAVGLVHTHLGRSRFWNNDCSSSVTLFSSSGDLLRTRLQISPTSDLAEQPVNEAARNRRKTVTVPDLSPESPIGSTLSIALSTYNYLLRYWIDGRCFLSMYLECVPFSFMSKTSYRNTAVGALDRLL